MFLVSRLEQFQRCPLNWCWHSWMAIWIPWIAEAVTSGLRMHTSSWRRVKPGRVRHTVLAFRIGSMLGSFRPKISLESTLHGAHRSGYLQDRRTTHKPFVSVPITFVTCNISVSVCLVSHQRPDSTVPNRRLDLIDPIPAKPCPHANCLKGKCTLEY